MNERLLSVLIGLARATEGNEELVTEETRYLLFQGLSMLYAASLEEDGTEDTCTKAHQLTELLAGIRKEKKRLVPNCFDCASPCGRTADYDMREFWDAEKECIQIKSFLVRLLAEKAEEVILQGKSNAEQAEVYFEALVVLGWNGSRESLLRIQKKIED